MARPYAPVPKQTADVAKIFDEAYEDKVRAQAQEHREDAIDTLAELASGKDSEGEQIETSPGVRRGAANDLIEHGHSRASGKAGQVAAATKGGIHISIIMQGEKPDVVLEAFEVEQLPEDPPASAHMQAVPAAAEDPLAPRWSKWDDEADMTTPTQEETEDEE